MFQKLYNMYHDIKSPEKFGIKNHPDLLYPNTHQPEISPSMIWWKYLLNFIISHSDHLRFLFVTSSYLNQMETGNALSVAKSVAYPKVYDAIKLGINNLSVA